MSSLMRKALPGGGPSPHQPPHHHHPHHPHHLHHGLPKPPSGLYPPRGSPPPPPPPGHPFAAPPGAPDSNACKLIKYRERDVAAFLVDGRELICLPQAFELFLKELVGGLHTVYTKLKRLDIQPVVCNVEQVRVLRGLGAIQPGVNRCKLISCDEFDVLYDDCTNSNARPGRPPKRSPSIHASPETIEKLKKTRMEGPEFGGYDPRYFAGDHKALMNGFPNPFLAPYMHMGVNAAGLIPQHAVTPGLFAASQFAMRSGSDHAVGTVKDAKSYLDQQDIFARHGQDGLAGLRMFAGAPTLTPDVALAARHADVDHSDRATPLSPDKPMNLSNVNGRSGLPLPPSGLKHSDDDDDESINDEKITSDDNDLDADNSNDSYAQQRSGDEDLQLDGGNKAGGSLGRPELVGFLNGLGPGPAVLEAGAGQGDLAKVLLALIELGKQAYALHAANKQQQQQGRYGLLDRDNMEAELRRQIHLRQDFERKLKEQEEKNEVLEMRCRRLKKQASRRLERRPNGTGSGPNSPLTNHVAAGTNISSNILNNLGSGSSSGGNNSINNNNNNNINNRGGLGLDGDLGLGLGLGLDLALKTPGGLDNVDTARALTAADAAESESEGEKNMSDRQRSLSGPLFYFDVPAWGMGFESSPKLDSQVAAKYGQDRSAKTSKLNEHLERIMAKRMNGGDPKILNGDLKALNRDLQEFYGEQNRNESKCLDALSDQSVSTSGESDLSETESCRNVLKEDCH